MVLMRICANIGEKSEGNLNMDCMGNRYSRHWSMILEKFYSLPELSHSDSPRESLGPSEKSSDEGYIPRFNSFRFQS